MSEEKIFFLLFPAIHDVLKAEKKLKKDKIDYELVPVPRNLSSDCGVCIKIKNLDLIKHLENLRIETCYFFDGNSFNEITLK
ncbi:MAG TPA: DUF3343 domain-containing protein [Syntrophorhabdaceae bacterium]|nr:DUF3343 domain-containing protein [Syntrophorhabdaceae bacterium]